MRRLEKYFWNTVFTVGLIAFAIILMVAVRSYDAEAARIQAGTLSSLESTYSVTVVDPAQLSKRGSDNKVHDVLLRRDNVTLTCTVYVKTADPVDAVAFCDGPSKELDRRTR